MLGAQAPSARLLRRASFRIPAAMSSPQNSPERKKQKYRATRKLAKWRQKREAEQAAAKPAK